MKQNDINGVVLAGGLSKRFGSPKAFALYKGKYFYQHIIEAMKNHVDVTTIVSHPDIKTNFPPGSANFIIEDVKKYQGLGPLAGIYSAMKTVHAKWYLIFACDMPNISPDFVERILQKRQHHVQIIVPVINGTIQPLAGVYHYSVLDKIEHLLLNRNLKLKTLFDKCHTLQLNEDILQIDEQIFVNVNNQEEYKKLS